MFKYLPIRQNIRPLLPNVRDIIIQEKEHSSIQFGKLRTVLEKLNINDIENNFFILNYLTVFFFNSSLDNSVHYT